MQKILENVFAAIDAARMPHACFFSCPDAGFAEDAAEKCAQRFLGCTALSNFPDYFDITCPVAVDTLREMLAELSKVTFGGANRCVRFTSAHMMSEASQNIFLKTLEEPPDKTLFLLCGNLPAMLPTIRSRCCVVRLGTPSYDEMYRILLARGVNDTDAMLYARVGDSLAQAYRLCTDPDARTARERAMEDFGMLLRGAPPYAASKAIQSSKANAREQAMDYASSYLSFARDLLACREGLPLRNTDMKDTLAALARHFTSGQINGMIEKVTAAIARLHTPVSAGAALDMMMTQILEETTLQHEKH